MPLVMWQDGKSRGEIKQEQKKNPISFVTFFLYVPNAINICRGYNSIFFIFCFYCSNFHKNSVLFAKALRVFSTHIHHST